MHLCSRLKSDARRLEWLPIARQGSAERPYSPFPISAGPAAPQECDR